MQQFVCTKLCSVDLFVPVGLRFLSARAMQKPGTLFSVSKTDAEYEDLNWTGLFSFCEL
jgi:hypothetical protein